MGLQIILFIHQQEAFKFDDIAALNQDLMDNTSFGELFSDMETGTGTSFEGPFKIVDGMLKIASNWDGYFEGYDANSMVWGCYGDDVWQTIAKHLTTGKLVFHLEIEGNPDEYYIVTPGRHEMKNAAKIRF